MLYLPACLCAHVCGICLPMIVAILLLSDCLETHVKVTGVLARRGYNIQSLAVGNSETADLSCITTVIPGSKESSAKVIKQLLKLIHVHSVTDLSDLPFITRELMLIKCRCRPSERKELIDLAEIFHGNICDVSRTTITLEVQGKEMKMRAVQDLLEPYGKRP